MTILSAHLTNSQINKCFNDLVNTKHEHCCFSLLQVLHAVDVCPSDIEDTTSESKSDLHPLQHTPLPESKATTPIELDNIQPVSISHSIPKNTPTTPQARPSPNVEEILALQTITLEEGGPLTQSQPTQITDTQCAAFVVAQEIPSQDNHPLSVLHTPSLTDTQVAATESLPVTLSGQLDSLLQPTEVTDTQLAASHTSEATVQDHQPHPIDASPNTSTSPYIPLSSDAPKQVTTQPAQTYSRESQVKRQVHFDFEPPTPPTTQPETKKAPHQLLLATDTSSAQATQTFLYLINRVTEMQ